MSTSPLGPYQIQAAIAAVHDEAHTAADTDWPQILGLYTLLECFDPSPMVPLNRAVAEAMVHGPEHALRTLDELEADGRLAGHHRLHSVRAHLLERAGRTEEALVSYRAATAATLSIPEQRYLRQRANHHRLHSVRAHLLERAGRTEEALVSYRAATAATLSIPEQRYLRQRANHLRTHHR